MLNTQSFKTLFAGILAFSFFLGSSAFAQNPKRPAKPKPPKVSFSVKQLHIDNNEGCAVGDINKDGHMDVTAGEFWYAGSDFKQHPLRKTCPSARTIWRTTGNTSWT